MSSTNKHNATYSAADIEKYLKGELSPREMHDLENAALEDPFLADALEGMSILLSPPAAANEKPGNPDDSRLSRDLDELHARLNTKVAASPDSNSIRRTLPRWSIAAAIILLLGIGLFYWLFSAAGDRTLRAPVAAAKADTAIATSPAAVADAAPPEPSSPVTSSPAPPAPPLRAHALSSLRTAYVKKQSPSPGAKPSGTAVATDSVEMLVDRKAGLVINSDLEKRIRDADTLQALRLALSKSMFRDFDNAAASTNVFRGVVLDNHNNPLPGASLTLKGFMNTGTVTDKQGQFSLPLRPQDSTQYLTVAMVGYEQKSLPLNILTANDLANNVIHLQPNESSLDEVVVTGFGSKRKETLAAAPSYSKEELDSLWQKASPVIGRNAYLQYLATAQKTLALDSTIKGTETISFDVDRTGALTSFKIEQSLSPIHDAAIIRLVKEGPDWILLKGKKIRAVVSLHF
jgi:CarboxypepD_reg-like domain